MRAADRFHRLDQNLSTHRALWHSQPFREARPEWCRQYPALAESLLALTDEQAFHLNDEGIAALALLEKHVPELREFRALTDVPSIAHAPLKPCQPHWAWEIPGRKRSQIEAFAASTESIACPVLDWCGGKGHLGRLLALQWQTHVDTLEIDSILCTEGAMLAGRQRVDQDFVLSDALTAADWPKTGQHAVALHACGNLHRKLIEKGAKAGVSRFDLAPCCYHRGVTDHYQAMSGASDLQLSCDDTRLAVTETVTASPRQARRHSREMAWKLGFIAFREHCSESAYQNFKPVPAAWFRGSFSDFLDLMADREGLKRTLVRDVGCYEQAGWQRQREVTRLSIVRHVFRRPLEIWLALDLVVYLEQQNYAVRLGSFCERRLTPRNLLISAQRVS